MIVIVSVSVIEVALVIGIVSGMPLFGLLLLLLLWLVLVLVVWLLFLLLLL